MLKMVRYFATGLDKYKIKIENFSMLYAISLLFLSSTKLQGIYRKIF